MRTTLLLSFAACVAMLQANLLMNTVGRAPDSFVTLDPMRLPLGILSGVGFIGAGAILRRDNLVLGVTTAATMWFVTVMGLCFVGRVGLGLVAFALARLVLSLMKGIDSFSPRQQRASLTLMTSEEGFSESELQSTLEAEGRKMSSWAITYLNSPRVRTVRCELLWRPDRSGKETPGFIDRLARRPGVEELEWKS